MLVDEYTVNELNSYVFKGENNLSHTIQVENDHEYIDNSLLESITCHQAYFFKNAS